MSGKILLANEIIQNVDTILRLKNDDVNFDICIYGKQIDQLGYQLYDLTAEEIAIIENGVK